MRYYGQWTQLMKKSITLRLGNCLILKGRTNVHKMVLSLTVADLIVSYIVIPLEIGWRISVQVNNFIFKICYSDNFCNEKYVCTMCPLLSSKIENII